MTVHYDPPLMEQIRHQRRERLRAAERPVLVRVAGRFVERVDPVTMCATGEPQQFTVASGGDLTVLDRREYGAEPAVIEVDWMDFR